MCLVGTATHSSVAQAAGPTWWELIFDNLVASVLNCPFFQLLTDSGVVRLDQLDGVLDKPFGRSAIKLVGFGSLMATAKAEWSIEYAYISIEGFDPGSE
jgi:hypothetical protein